MLGKSSTDSAAWVPASARTANRGSATSNGSRRSRAIEHPRSARAISWCDRGDRHVKRYFRHEAESDYGPGIAYLEIDGEWPSRQVEIYGEIWLWGDEAHPKNLADQPFEFLDLHDEHEIPAGEFERVWREANKRCPPTS